MAECGAAVRADAGGGDCGRWGWRALGWGARGRLRSSDGGASWATPRNLYLKDVNSIFFDERNQCVLLTGNQSTTMAFSVRVPDLAVTYWDTGWNLRFLRPVGSYLIGATMYDGIVVQPRMVKSESVGH